MHACFHLGYFGAPLTIALKPNEAASFTLHMPKAHHSQSLAMESSIGGSEITRTLPQLAHHMAETPAVGNIVGSSPIVNSRVGSDTAHHRRHHPYPPSKQTTPFFTTHVSSKIAIGVAI